MNGMQIFLLVLAGIFVVLLPISRQAAFKYAHVAVLILVATIMLTPFAWLICSAFKDTNIMNQYAFLPPPSQISSQTVNLSNFRGLFTPTLTRDGPIGFWRYVVNSLFLASAITFISLFFSSLGGFALAKYRFRGRNVLMVYMLASMTIPAVVLLAPISKLSGV